MIIVPARFTDHVYIIIKKDCRLKIQYEYQSKADELRYALSGTFFSFFFLDQLFLGDCTRYVIRTGSVGTEY